MPFKRTEHQRLAEILAGMNRDRLLACRCYFGGGTAIVLKHGEYRTSLDFDFLCADQGGYRELRNAFFSEGPACIFDHSVAALRDVRADGYGIRTLIGYQNMSFKFEIIREARISLDGGLDPDLMVPTLTRDDLFAEKLLANADRCFDRAVAFRDAIDLGKLVEAHGSIPPQAIVKAETAYGPDISRKLVAILNHLLDTSHIRYAAEVLSMDEAEAVTAIVHLRDATRERWPDAPLLES